MRYDPRKRIDYPDAEDMKVWEILAWLNGKGIRTERIPYVPRKGANKREHWYALGRVWLDDERYFLLEYKDTTKLEQHRTCKMNKQSKERVKYRHKTWKDMGIPIMLVDRTWTTQIMGWYVKKFYDDLKGEQGE